MRNHKLKVLSLALLVLSGCNNTGNSGGGTGSTQTEGGVTTSTRPKVVMISSISTIPTNLGVSGGHTLKVDNFTGKNLTLKDFEIADSEHTNLLAKGYSALKAAIGAIGYDTRVNLSSCSSLVANNSCVIVFSPDEADGSTALRLTFIDESGNLFSAAQLIEYSSAVNKVNGFYVSNAHITNVTTTNDYSVSIPFVSDDDYKSIEIDSRIVTLSKNVDCANGASKGAHCTAVITLPAADPKSGGYDNPIVIKGTKTDGSVNYATLSSGTTFNDIAHLAITSGPLVIAATDSANGHASLSKTINIVNNGANDAVGVSSTSLINDHWLYGETITAGASLLTKEIKCGGTTVTSLPDPLVQGNTCQVKFTLNNPNATGSEDYKISYTGGADGDLATTASTKVYYRGLVVPDFTYIVTGNIDFTNVRVGSSISTQIVVKNTGTKPLKDISYSSSPALPAGVTVDASVSSCDSSTQLRSGESCTYSLKYTPTAATAAGIFNFKVTAKNTAIPSVEVTPSQSLAISYSATNSAGNGLVIVNNSNGYLIFADNLDKRTSRILIQNTGTTDFNLREITASGWSTKLSLNAPVDATTTVPGNPLTGISFTNGVSNTAKTIPAGKIAALDYTYGPTSVVESGLARQNFVGKFGGAGTDYIVANNTAYAAVSTATGISVTNEPVTVTSGATGITGTTGANPSNSFVLTKNNQAKVKFKYTAGSAGVNGFLVNDANLPFGFMVDTTGTTCPTTSRASAAANLNANANCIVSYTYLANELNHSLFYTAAVAGVTEIIAPAYSIKDSTGIHVVTPANKIKLTPSPFVTVAATSSKITVGSDRVHTVTFTASGSANTLLPSAQVLVAPTFVAGTYPKNARSCTITTPNTAGANCSIEIVQSAAPAAASITVPFTYSSTQDADFNARNSSITLTR